jgi:hypothetical protein
MERFEYKERLDLLTFILTDNGCNHKVKTINNENINFSIKIFENDGIPKRLDVDFGDTIYHITTNVYYIVSKWELIQQLHAKNV